MDTSINLLQALEALEKEENFDKRYQVLDPAIHATIPILTGENPKLSFLRNGGTEGRLGYLSALTEARYNTLAWQKTVPESLAVKPTWNEAVEAYFSVLLAEDDHPSSSFLGTDRNFAKHSERTKSELSDNLLEHAKKNIYTGGGLSHMTGLAHLVESSNLAGHRFTPVHLRDSENKEHTFFTQKNIREFLLKLAERENIVESAHNRIVRKVRELEAIWHDATKTNKERVEARETARRLTWTGSPNSDDPEFVPNLYLAALQKEIDSYDADALPTDIDELRQVWLERLEAVATQKIADLKNAATQHGVDLPESCIDQVNATRRVANKSQKGKIELRRATTGKEMKDLFDTYKFRIESVKVKNVPKWKEKDGSRSYFENDGTSALELAGRQFEFVAFSPDADPPIPGKVAAESFEVWTLEGGIFDRISASIQNEKIRFIFDADVAHGTQIRVRLGARNICGPSHLHILLTAGPVPT